MPNKTEKNYREWNKFVFTQMDTNLAYVLGVYLGDGYVYEKSGSLLICLAVQDIEFIQKYAQAIRHVIGKEPRIDLDRTNQRKHGGALIYRATTGSNSLGEWLKLKTKEKTIIPEEVYQDKEIAKSFLQGVMDSEGTVGITNTKGINISVSGTQEWFDDLAKVMDFIGLKHGRLLSYWKYKIRKYEKRFNINHVSYKALGLSFNLKKLRDRLHYK